MAVWMVRWISKAIRWIAPRRARHGDIEAEDEDALLVDGRRNRFTSRETTTESP